MRRRATTYLPSTLLAAIERHGGDRTSFIEPTDGTLVFADVSGFTPLSEALAATGREGAERLTAVLNDFFGRMLDIAATWGGSNQKFGGDAMLLLYSGPDHARRAVEASLDMQRETTRFPAVRVGAGRHKLAMSVGVHSGRPWAAGVGVPDVRMQHVLLGADCGRVAEVEAAASAGEVVVSAETRALLGDGIATTGSESTPGMYVVGRRRRRIRPLPRAGERPSPSDARLRAYLPPPLARALGGDAEAGGRVEDEHRRVVVLFVSVVGLNELLASAGPDVALGQAQAYVSTLVELTERHGGFISNNDIDSSGLKFIVLFGAPVAREDDAASAMRLAADLVDEVARRGIRVRHRIGINSGYVFAGDVGSDLRRDYTVIGDAVNLAARLMGAAEPGRVVVADWVATEAGDGFELRDRRTIRVKGKSMAIAVHSLVGLRAPAAGGEPAGPAPVVIGRERERRALRRAASRAHAGSAQLVAVHGEAGAGGSALVAELVHELTAAGWSAHRGRARQHLRDVPFGPVVDLFERLLGIVGVGDPSARGAAVVAALESEIPAMAPLSALLNGLLSIDVPESDVVRALDPTERADRLVTLLVALVGAATEEEPLVLTVEGLHFADRATIRFLEQGMRSWRGARLLVVVSYRDDLAPELAPPRARTTDLALGPLDRSDSDALVRHLLGRPDVPESLLAEIFQRSRGTPLVTAELARAVGASELLDTVGEPDPRQVRELLGGLDVPDRLQRLVMARIDRLAPAPRWALTRAAVIGSSFDRPALQALVAAEGRRLSLPAAMRQLAEVGLVGPDPRGRGAYVFGHEAIRDVAYDSLLFRTRRELHHELARHLQERHAADLDREAATIAGHLRIARDHEAAGVFGLRAGDFAMASYAVDEAEASFAGALDDFRQAGPHLARERSYASERIGDCAALAGRAPEAVTRYQQALRSWRRAGDESTPLADPRLAGDHPLDEREAELSQKVARAQQGADRYDRALEWLDRAERAAPRRSPRLMAELSALRSGTQFRLGRYSDAAREGARALGLAERTGDAVTIGYARNLLAGIYLEQGRLEDAIEQRTRAVRLFEEAGDLRGAMVGHGNLGASYQLVGDLDAARRHYERAGEAAARLGNAQGQALIENNVGEVLLVQGRLDEAAARFTTTVRLHEQTAHAPVWAGLAQINLSRVALRRGDLVTAHRALDQGTRLLRRARARGLLLEATHQRVTLQVAEGEVDAAERANRRFAADARRKGMQLFEARSAILAGRIALARGRRGPAAVELGRAIALAESAGARPEQAEAWTLLADAGLDDGAATRAAELATALGVTPAAFSADTRAC